MIVRHTKTLLGMMSFCLLFAQAIAQNTQEATDSRPKTSAEALRSYGIELSEQSLIAALSNADPTVRVLAADRLAHDKDYDAIPSVERALSDEKDPMARVGISAALWALHDPVGAQHLVALCTDTKLPIRVIIDAVQMLQLFALSSGRCADTVLNSVNQAGYVDYRSVTLTLLPVIYREVPREQADRILSVIQNLLRDEKQDPAVRLAASHALAQLDAPSSLGVIRDALLREQDPVLRSNLQDDLATLETRQ